MTRLRVKLSSLVLSICIACATAGFAAAKPVSIVAIGASNTTGMQVSANDNYPSQLQKMLRQKGYDVRVTNAGVPGDTTEGVLRRLNTAIPRGTDIVILAPPVGNDFLLSMRRKGPPDPKRIEANIETAIQRLKARHIAVAYLSLGKDDGAIARKYGLPFCHFPRDPRLFNPGAGRHYTPEGYRMMAARVLPCVQQLLAQ